MTRAAYEMLIDRAMSLTHTTDREWAWRWTQVAAYLRWRMERRGG